jgi:hypothetical protein
VISSFLEVFHLAFSSDNATDNRIFLTRTYFGEYEKRV